jgi:ADP-heptose:LPS heptosyltransferase
VPLFDIEEQELAEIDRWLSVRRSSPGSSLVSMAPGCKTRANEWPIENFVELGRRLTEKYGFEIIITGGKGDAALATQLTESWGQGISAAGELTVRQSAALLSRCDFHIGLDTGTTHLAAAVGTRCLAIYGERNNPGHWYPLGNGHMLLFHAVPCAACRLTVCPVPGHPCMRGVSADSAWHCLEELLRIDPVSSGTTAIAV